MPQDIIRPFGQPQPLRAGGVGPLPRRQRGRRRRRRVRAARGHRRPARAPAADPPTGPTETTALVRVRRVQSFFRTAVFVSCDGRCALTGLAVPALLTASHIIPWSADPHRRADPRNGLCLNALHDRAFDRGLITFDDQLRLVVSPALGGIEAAGTLADALLGLADRRLRVPDRFSPDDVALAYHRAHVFRSA